MGGDGVRQFGKGLAINPRPLPGLAGRPFAFNKSVNVAKKRAIAKAAVEMCKDGEAVIINDQSFHDPFTTGNVNQNMAPPCG